MVTQSGLKIAGFQQKRSSMKNLNTPLKVFPWEAAWVAGGTFHPGLRKGLSSAVRGSVVRVCLWAATNNVLWRDRRAIMHAVPECPLCPPTRLSGNIASKNKPAHQDWLMKNYIIFLNYAINTKCCKGLMTAQTTCMCQVEIRNLCNSWFWNWTDGFPLSIMHVATKTSQCCCKTIDWI